MAFAASLSIAPPLIVDCQNGLDIAQLNWANANGTVQVRVNQPNGSPLTGFSDPSGSATTGPWVTDGMKFFLVDQFGTVEATAVAHLNCGGTIRTVDPGLQTGSLSPAARWQYLDL